MRLPRVLLVDDSEAMLGMETAALTGHCELMRAHDGREALEAAREHQPDGMVLDLSMPHLRGEDVLRALSTDDGLRRIPVVVCSTESERAPECLRLGARAFVRKPFEPAQLRQAVLQMIRAAQDRALAALFVRVGDLSLGVPVDAVKSVVHQVATRPLPFGPAYLSEVTELFGEPVLVLDLARRLGVAHARPLAERALVLLHVAGGTLALCVDEVHDPEELSPDSLVRREQLPGAEHGGIALLAMAKTQRGPLPVVDPAALASPRLLRELRHALAGAP